MTTELFRKKSDRTRNLSIGAAVAAAGVGLYFFAGNAGAIVVVVGVMILMGAVLRSRQALVSIDSKAVQLRFKQLVSVPFKSIARADHLKNHDIELCLHSGDKVLVQMADLEEEDGAWLRKTLRKEIRTANA